MHKLYFTLLLVPFSLGLVAYMHQEYPGFSELNEKRQWPTLEKSRQAKFTFSAEDTVTPFVEHPGVRNPNQIIYITEFASLAGRSVAMAGDVNGDGYADVLMGAPNCDNDHQDAGQANLYYGSDTGIVRNAAWIAEGNLDSANFGLYVSSAGDVNGDGFADVMVAGSKGAVALYFGSKAGLNTVADWTGPSGVTSIASAGDVNNDGYDDLIFGFAYYTNGESKEGRALLYFGSVDGPGSSAAWAKELNLANAHFGFSVSSAGDVNSDGYDDVVIGSPGIDTAFIYHGSDTGPGSEPAGILTAEVLYSSFGYAGTDRAGLGYAVASAGDVNKDGFGDVVIGIPYFTRTGGSPFGKVVVYYGSDSGLANLPNWTMETNQYNSLFGTSVGAAGDLNGDGYDDIIVGAPQYKGRGEGSGGAAAYFGSSTGLSTSIDRIFETDFKYQFIGQSLSGGGDINKDGFDDVFIGGPGTLGAASGRAFLYFGYPVDPRISTVKNIFRSVANNRSFTLTAQDFKDVFIGTDGDTLEKIRIVSVSGGELHRNYLGNYLDPGDELRIDDFNTIIYTPPNIDGIPYTGPDMFTFTAAGIGNYAGNTANVKINVTAPDYLPHIRFLNMDERGEVFRPGTPVNIEVIATDEEGPVAKVEFFNGAQKIGEDRVGEYRIGEVFGNDIFSLQTETNVPGKYPLTVRATENTGATVSTDTVWITIAPGSTCSASGSISLEGYANIPGPWIEALYGWFNSPSEYATIRTQLDKLEYGNNIADNYGTRVRGYICPPQTGNYTFYIASDDNSELWLSGNENRTNRRRIAFLTSRVAPRAWNTYYTQKSAPVKLLQGVRYYIEVFHKEDTGADHLSVAWTLPDGSFEGPIPGTRLSPYQIFAGQRLNTIKELDLKQLPGEAREKKTEALKVIAGPIPSSGAFTIIVTSNNHENLEVSIIDIAGRIVERKMQQPANSTFLVGSNLKVGVYFLEVVQGSQREKLKLIKQ